MHDEIRTLALRIGEAAISKPALAAEIARRSERLDHLHDLQSHFDTIRTVSSQIKASGAPQWAQQLLSNPPGVIDHLRSEEHTSELQSLMRISYAHFCLKNKKNSTNPTTTSFVKRRNSNKCNKVNKTKTHEEDIP